jgi:hypothetical protein
MMRPKRLLGGMVGTLLLFFGAAGAQAQNKEPIKIGFSMELTGPFAVVGKTRLLAFKIWEEEINANGALDPLPRGRRENWGGTNPLVPIL